MPAIRQWIAQEILDSRGRPTVAARCILESGASAAVSVPSGASTGTAEALELRDGDPQRYRGLGCRAAVQNVNTTIQDALAGRSFANQGELDRALIDLDGTPNKARLGANAILAVSLAFCRAVAAEQNIPLYRHFAQVLAGEEQVPASEQEVPALSLPRPTINLFSGGKHAGGQVAIQDVLVVPASATTIDDALAMTYAVYQAAADLTLRRYDMRALKADEGGLAPPFPDVATMLDDAVAAIEAAGYQPGRDVALAVDVASSHFFRDGRYYLAPDAVLTSAQMIDQVADWVAHYPIVSVEDALAEDDWQHWPALRERLRSANRRVLVLGDDFLCTNPSRIRRAVDENAASALLLKVNQIGTVSEAAEACRLARSAGWAVTVSARSGETEDNWLADLSVGWAGDQIKVGSITQSERLAKYNRLLAIEREAALPLVNWPN